MDTQPEEARTAFRGVWNRIERAFSRLPWPKRMHAGKKWLVPCAGALVLVVAFGVFSDKGVVLPMDEIAKGASKWRLSSSRDPAPRIEGKTLLFPGRLNLGSYDIPLERQSRRIAFDFRTTGTTGVERGYTSIHLFTCEAADAVFITIRDEGIFVSSRRDSSDKAVKVSDPTSKWKHVEAVMKPDKTIVSVSGKRIVFPAMNGVRWTHLTFTVLKPNLQLGNVRSFPAKKHAKAARLFSDGIIQALDDDPDASRKGVRMLLKAAEGGLAEAQFFYAGLPRLEIVDLSEAESFQWFLKAARQGHIGAQGKVGEAYLFGNGVRKDEKKARDWLVKSSESGNPHACLLCGFVLIHAKTIPRDLKNARTFLMSALQSVMLDEKKFDDTNKALLYELLAEAYLLPEDGTRDEKLGVGYLRDAVRYGSDSARSKLKDLGY